MNGVAWTIVALGIGVVVVRRRSIAVALVTTQALLLAAAAFNDGGSLDAAVAATALAIRGAVLAALFLFLVWRTREARPVRAGVAPLARAAAAIALALTLIWLIPPIGLDSQSAERATLTLVAFGLIAVATRRATLFQVLGIVLVENGLALAALSLPGSSSLAIEVGVAVDLLLIALVAGVFHERIFAEFGAGDSAALGRSVTTREWLATAVLVVPLAGVAAAAVAPPRLLARVETAIALLTATAAGLLAVVALAEPGERQLGQWIVVDPAGGLLVGVIGVVGLASALVSRDYLGGRHGSLFRADRADRIYWATLFAFWAVLLAVPLAGNLGAAWLAIEATTAASALLVGFSGRPRALEAGWKYLILTSLGLGVALLGILVLQAAAGGGGLETLTWRGLPHASLNQETAVVAYVLLLAGLAAKVGWAPVHNWLPDAHSEAPAPVSALLSAALLPAVLLVAWRSQQALTPTIGARTAGGVLVGFGLVSLAVAVPFLWRPQAWKRLLAYSSLEHMGVVALGIGFGGTTALAGVVIHIAGHALAKALGFYAATPLLAHSPRAAQHPVGGIGRTQPALGASLGISLGALAGLPPSPLFVSEVLIVAGGFQVGRPWAAAAAAILLALGFLGLAHALIDTVVGKPRGRDRHPAIGLRTVTTLTAITVPLLLALTAAALWLPDSAIVRGLERGLG